MRRRNQSASKTVCLLIGLAAVVLSACNGGSNSGFNQVQLPQARNTLPSLNPSDSTFNGDHHAGAGACAACHNAPEMRVDTGVPGESRSVAINNAWETSIMANATRDPYWHAAYALELYNFPQLEDDINDKCMVCHAPLAHDFARKTGTDLRLFDKGSVENGDFQQGIYTMDSTSELYNHAMDGISCTLCHQMDGTNFGTEESFTGGFVINGSPTGDRADRPAYGQYTDPEVGYMRQISAFTAQHGPHISQSESCATCHNLNIQPVDPEGNLLTEVGHFAEQAIFSEWQVSDYAIGGPKEASCQSCHMPKVDQDVPMAQGADKRPDFAEHTFYGANTVMQDMFSNFAEELGIDPSLDFDQAIEGNRQFLESAATISLSETPPDQVFPNDDITLLSFDVDIENKTGHKLPGGYHARRVYLHVQVLNQNNELVFESGRINPDGSIVGVAEDLNPAVWEPHYDVISREDQVQVYQAIVGDIEGNRSHSLLSGAYFLKDNRLPPAGYFKQAVTSDPTYPETFGTFGAAMGDTDFDDGKDTVTYQVPVSGPGVYTVSVALRYQPLNFGHLQQLFTLGEQVDAVDRFRTIYNATELRDEFIDTAIQNMIAQ